MKLRNLKQTPAMAAFLVPGLFFFASTSCGAEILPLPGNPAAQQTTQSTPELDAANDKLEQAKAKLELARKQLNAAKAMLKAADSEFRACRADRDALALRIEANKLADASGLPTTVTTPPDITTNRLYPVAQEPAPPVDLSKTRIQQLDFNSQQGDGGDAQEPPLAPRAVASKAQIGAPIVPMAELKPQRVPTVEPSSVP